MKKTILMSLAICFISVSYAQSEKYVGAMTQNIARVDAIMAKNNAGELANNFLRIAEAEKTQWLPYYYAAYCKATEAFTEKDNTKKDALANKATEMLEKAEAIIGKENSETDVIKSMIATAHMMVDPQSRYMTYGPQSAEFLKKSIALDPHNPRPVLLEAQNTFYTPETFGGGKKAAKPLFDKAAELFGSFKPEAAISPDWGRTNLDYFLSQYQ